MLNTVIIKRKLRDCKCFVVSSSILLVLLSRTARSVQIRSFFWSVFFCIRTEYRKIRPEKTLYLNTFHAVTAITLYFKNIICCTLNPTIFVITCTELPWLLSYRFCGIIFNSLTP